MQVRTRGFFERDRTRRVARYGAGIGALIQRKMARLGLNAILRDKCGESQNDEIVTLDSARRGKASCAAKHCAP